MGLDQGWGLDFPGRALLETMLRRIVPRLCLLETKLHNNDAKPRRNDTKPCRNETKLDNNDAKSSNNDAKSSHNDAKRVRVVQSRT